MNIMINDNCNMNCSYCFAPKDRVKEMTKEDFNYLVGLMKRSNHKALRILGGEPTIHPNFIEFVRTGINDSFFNEVAIFSNGLALTKKVSEKIVSAKTVFLINVNSPEDIGKEKYNVTMKNLKILVREYKDRGLTPRVVLGINIYLGDFDYQYILDAAKKLGLSNIRYSISVPIGKDKVSLDYYRKFIPRLMEFLDDCHKLNYKANLDCNNIPPCLFTAEQMANLVGSNHDIVTTRQFCDIPMDVTPDLKVSRCMAFMDTELVDVKDYNSIQDINRYFISKIDSQKFKKPSFDECNDCKLFDEGKCQGSCLCNKFR